MKVLRWCVFFFGGLAKLNELGRKAALDYECFNFCRLVEFNELGGKATF